MRLASSGTKWCIRFQTTPLDTVRRQGLRRDGVPARRHQRGHRPAASGWPLASRQGLSRGGRSRQAWPRDVGGLRRHHALDGPDTPAADRLPPASPPWRATGPSSSRSKIASTDAPTARHWARAHQAQLARLVRAWGEAAAVLGEPGGEVARGVDPERGSGAQATALASSSRTCRRARAGHTDIDSELISATLQRCGALGPGGPQGVRSGRAVTAGIAWRN